jgi:acetyl esterase/lipase
MSPVEGALTPVEGAPLRDVSLTKHKAKGPEGAPDVELFVYRPTRPHGKLGCVVHVHGGGFVCGCAELCEPQDRVLSHDLHCVVVNFNYRLAPETRFPGNVEDCYATLTWVFNHAEELGIDRERIGLLGESGGGGLAASLALLVRDRGVFRLAFQHLIYPMIDDRTCVSNDPNPYTGEFVWTRQSNHFGWSSLLGMAPGADGVSSYAAAGRSNALEGLPPTFISTAMLDLFLEENIVYAQRLMRAGVSTELHVYPGAFHGFDYEPNSEVARTARRDSRAALSRFLRNSSQETV